jgi:hypothetical protein
VLVTLTPVTLPAPEMGAQDKIRCVLFRCFIGQELSLQSSDFPFASPPSRALSLSIPPLSISLTHPHQLIFFTNPTSHAQWPVVVTCYSRRSTRASWV